ncbi:hypothetical protein Pmani_028224 [Petrolisthes manimaculis]|uniref:Uncharacterized protein n=1 Tax=Petrolisthes manimaculis TaxID=1843537 RepID=A0AAE1TY71_9EUCA|nr:hypothetical protein Pmani_028224 [Petrolisthes manimaculis]
MVVIQVLRVVITSLLQPALCSLLPACPLFPFSSLPSVPFFQPALCSLQPSFFSLQLSLCSLHPSFFSLQPSLCSLQSSVDCNGLHILLYYLQLFITSSGFHLSEIFVWEASDISTLSRSNREKLYWHPLVPSPESDKGITTVVTLPGPASTPTLSGFSARLVRSSPGVQQYGEKKNYGTQIWVRRKRETNKN